MFVFDLFYISVIQHDALHSNSEWIIQQIMRAQDGRAGKKEGKRDWLIHKQQKWGEACSDRGGWVENSEQQLSS